MTRMAERRSLSQGAECIRIGARAPEQGQPRVAARVSSASVNWYPENR